MADLMLLTGTPLTKPGDAYAYIKSVAPAIYRNQRHFEQLHVEKRDFFGNVKEWCNLDVLAENMKVNSVRVHKRDVLTQLPPITFIPLLYELESAHQKLYEKLAEEQILLLEGGGKIDATIASKLYNALQQIVLNPGHFTGKPTRPAGYDLLDEVLEELACQDPVSGKKLLIFTHYKLTIRALVEYLAPFKPVAFFSDVSGRNQERNKDTFLDDPACRVAVAHVLSGGYGLDGMQEVCSDALFLECPTVPKDFEQGYSRLEREGQKNPMMIRIAIAEKTVQVRLHHNLLNADALVNRVQGGWQDLRDAIYGVV